MYLLNPSHLVQLSLFFQVSPLSVLVRYKTDMRIVEENVKIHSSQVHPLDHNSVPYNFSSTVSPLLHNAARALNLPARSQDHFDSVFNLGKSNGSASTSRSLKSESGENIPPVDTHYTGHIIVSGYSISFVLPRVFLSRRSNGSPLSDNDEDSVSQTPASRRRASVGERNQAQFMAAIDMWVPFASKPPRSPYLVCTTFLASVLLTNERLISSLSLLPVACTTTLNFAFSLLLTLQHLSHPCHQSKTTIRLGTLPLTLTYREFHPHGRHARIHIHTLPTMNHPMRQ